MDVSLIANTTDPQVFTSFHCLKYCSPLQMLMSSFSLLQVTHIAAKGNVVIVNPARETKPEKLQNMMKSIQSLSGV